MTVFRGFFLLLCWVPIFFGQTSDGNDLEAVIVEGEPFADIRSDVRGGGPSFEQEVVILVNQERWANGQLPPLKHVDVLDASSELHSNNMAIRNFFAHCDLDLGTEPGDRMSAAGYIWNAAAENIAAGQTDPAAVMVSWMGSSGHRANILSTTYRELGVGYVFQGGDTSNIRRDQNGDCSADGTYTFAFYRYWTQNFGRRSGVYPLVIEREAYETDQAMVSLYVYGPGNATEMRFRNEGGAWSSWQPFSNEETWSLAPGNGISRVDVQVRTGSGTVYEAHDTIVLMQACATYDQVEAMFPGWAEGSSSLLDMVLQITNLCVL